MSIYPTGMLTQGGESWTSMSGGYWDVHSPGVRTDIPHLAETSRVGWTG